MSDTAPPNTADGWELLCTPAGERALELAAEALREAGSLVSAASRLRGTVDDAGLAAAALSQVQLRAAAAAKFGALSARMLFTRAGLEQASRYEVAELHAARFAAAAVDVVADLGCGLGAESLALLRAGRTPLPVEIDPLVSRFAAHNLAVQASELGAPAPGVATADATIHGPGDADAVFLDPARRESGHTASRRIFDPESFSPPLRFALRLASNLPTGIKLGPGTPHEAVPTAEQLGGQPVEAEWVSSRSTTLELALWSGALARPGVGRAATVVNDDGQVHSLCGAESVHEAASEVEPGALGEYLWDPAGSVIRGKLLGELAELLGARTLAPGIAYLTADVATATPFAQCFRVLEVLPAGEKALRKALAARGIGQLEIKKRGHNIDPAQLRRQLKLRGDASATLLLTRDARGKHLAVLAERC